MRYRYTTLIVRLALCLQILSAQATETNQNFDLSKIANDDQKWLNESIKHLRNSAKENNLKILSWNIEEGRMSDKLQDAIQSMPDWGDLLPDIFIIQEYGTNSLKLESYAALEKIFPKRHLFYYQERPVNEVEILRAERNKVAIHARSDEEILAHLKKVKTLIDSKKEEGAGYRMAVFSRLPNMELLDQKQIDWAPPGLDELQLFQFKSKFQPYFSIIDPWIRPYIHYQITRNNKKIHFFPMHIVMPWHHYPPVHSKFQILNKIDITEKILNDEHSPHVEQLKNFNELLKADKTISNDDAVIAMGDFNVVLSVKQFGLSIESMSWKKLQEMGFQTAFTPQRNCYSYPSPSVIKHAQEKFPIQIDHSFFKGNIRLANGDASAQVLPIQGSDHFPIYVIYE